MDMIFYRCEICGKIVAVVKNTAAPTFCCGKPMQKIEPGTTDASVEKHVPVYEVKNNIITVTVGSVLHPMTEPHYIEWIAVQTTFGNQRKILKPGESPKATFALVDGDEVKTSQVYNSSRGIVDCIG